MTNPDNRPANAISSYIGELMRRPLQNTQTFLAEVNSILEKKTPETHIAYWHPEWRGDLQGESYCIRHIEHTPHIIYAGMTHPHFYPTNFSAEGVGNLIRLRNRHPDIHLSAIPSIQNWADEHIQQQPIFEHTYRGPMLRFDGLSFYQPKDRLIAAAIFLKALPTFNKDTTACISEGDYPLFGIYSPPRIA